MSGSVVMSKATASVTVAALPGPTAASRRRTNSDLPNATTVKCAAVGVAVAVPAAAAATSHHMPVDFFPPVVLSDPPFAPPWLVSFHVGRFAGFIAVTVGVGYPLYRLIGVRWLRWEAHPKSPAMHFGDVTSAIGYNLALFIGGNYSNTLT
ncbi:hypothetical protein HK405_013738, partial [Cladochytrium tenue]